MINEAVILAAGEGKRMKSNVPKPLLEVNGETIIVSKLKKLLSLGFSVCIVVNEKTKSMFEEKLEGYDVTYAVQGTEKGTAAALYAAKDFVKDDLFLVEMGDDLYGFDTEEVSKYDVPVVFGFEMDDVSGYGVLVTDEKGDVTDILEKQRSGKGLANTGMYVMPKSFFDIYDKIPTEEKSGERFLTHAVPILRENGVKFHAGKLDSWRGINTPEQLEAASQKDLENA